MMILIIQWNGMAETRIVRTGRTFGDRMGGKSCDGRSAMEFS